MPIEPVDPISATPVRGWSLARSDSAHRRQRSNAMARNHPATNVKMQRIDAVEKAAMSRDQVAAVLDARVALEHRFGQIAIEPNPGDDRAEEQSPEPMRR